MKVILGSQSPRRRDILTARGAEFTVIAANTIGYSDKCLVFWNINGFWDELIVLFDSLRKKGVMTKEYTEVFTFVNTLEEIKEIIG